MMYNPYSSTEAISAILAANQEQSPTHCGNLEEDRGAFLSRSPVFKK